MSRKALLLFLATGLAWGIPYFFIQIALEDFSSYSIIFIRVLIGAAIMVPLALNSGALKIALKHWKWVLFFAVIEMIIPWWFITEAGKHISSGLTALLIATVPMFGVVVASLVGDKTIRNPKTLFGMAIGFAGVVGLVGIDSLQGIIDPIWVGAVILAAIGYAVAPAVIAYKIGFVPTTGVISLSMVFVGMAYLVPALTQLPQEIANVPSLNSWLALAGLGAICSALAFVLFFALIREIGAARSTLIVYINTLVALLLGVVFLNEPITPGLLIGLPLVLIGSWLAGQKYQAKQPTAS
jgi:drug/metabolite transporter (DMT)-like permease